MIIEQTGFVEDKACSESFASREPKSDPDKARAGRCRVTEESLSDPKTSEQAV
jgi:hypothetical protein